MQAIISAIETVLTSFRFTELVQSTELAIIHDPTLRLIDVCLAADLPQATVIIQKYRASIDVDTFLSAVSRCANTAKSSARNMAIETVLEEFKSSISTSTINRAFVRACKFRSILIMPILMVFSTDLTPQTIETALILCKELSIEICTSIIKIWAKLRSPLRSWIQLTPTSIAIGHGISLRPKSDRYALRSILDDHYSSLPGILCEKYGCSCKNWAYPLEKCGVFGDIDMVKMLLKDNPKQAGLYLDQGVQGNNPGVVMLVIDEYGAFINHMHIEGALRTAIEYKFPFMVDILMNLFPSVLTEDLIMIFNLNCARGVYDIVELILVKCNQPSLFKDGFTFNPVRVRNHERIVGLLYAVYGSKLREQFPDWELEH